MLLTAFFPFFSPVPGFCVGNSRATQLLQPFSTAVILSGTILPTKSLSRTLERNAVQNPTPRKLHIRAIRALAGDHFLIDHRKATLLLGPRFVLRLYAGG